MEVSLPKQFKIKRVAELLGTRREHVYRMIKNNKLRLSGTKPYRVSLNELKRYMLDQYPVMMFIVHDLISNQINKTRNPF